MCVLQKEPQDAAWGQIFQEASLLKASLKVLAVGQVTSNYLLCRELLVSISSVSFSILTIYF